MTKILNKFRDLATIFGRGMRYAFGARDKYIGDYRYGQYHGQGSMFYADGDRYDHRLPIERKAEA